LKNPGLIALLILCFTFVGFLSGFYLGRNLNAEPIQVYNFSDPTDVQSSESDGTSSTDSTQPAIININTATKEQLETLPGIGPVLAQRILDYIQENGPFETMSQLTLVNGIGVKILEGILDFATVGG